MSSSGKKFALAYRVPLFASYPTFMNPKKEKINAKLV
jgi:hypothetical protein